MIIFLVGLFLSLYAGILSITLGIFRTLFPTSHPDFMWLGDTLTVLLIILVIGVILIIGTALILPLRKKPEEHEKFVIGLNAIKEKWSRVVIILMFIGGIILVLYGISYFPSYIIFAYIFIYIDIADFLNYFIPLYLVLLLGIFLTVLGLIILRRYRKSIKTNLNLLLENRYNLRSRIIVDILLILAFILLILFGTCVYAVIDGELLRWPWYESYLFKYFSSLITYFAVILVSIVTLINGVIYHAQKKKLIKLMSKRIKISNLEKASWQNPLVIAFTVLGAIGLSISVLPTSTKIAIPLLTYGPEWGSDLLPGIIFIICTILVLIGTMLIIPWKSYTIEQESTQ